MQYKILYDITIKKLVKDVERHLEQNWQLLGAPFPMAVVETGSCICQAMIREKK